MKRGAGPAWAGMKRIATVAAPRCSLLQLLRAQAPMILHLKRMCAALIRLLLPQKSLDLRCRLATAVLSSLASHLGRSRSSQRSAPGACLRLSRQRLPFAGAQLQLDARLMAVHPAIANDMHASDICVVPGWQCHSGYLLSCNLEIKLTFGGKPKSTASSCARIGELRQEWG